jgi:hypothetical protein
MRKREKKDHYVDNKQFYDAMVEYKKSWVEARENFYKKYNFYPKNTDDWEGRPEVPRFIGECLLKIATHLSYLPKFANYSTREDMVMDAVENSILYLYNFDPDYVSPKTGKKMNPFAYFTQISYYAFIRRIGRENRQKEIADKLLDRTFFDEVFTADAHYNTSDYNTIKDGLHSKNRY